MLTYAGSAITLVNEFMLPRIQRWWDVAAPDLWTFPGYSLEGLHHLPVPDRPKPQRARLNVLYWPTGASRWGVFHGLVDAAAATAIQTATGGYGSAPIAADLIIEDPIQDGSVISRTVTASMFLLAIRPVFVQGDHSFYWMTLVDRRYYYWLQDPTYTFADGDSWADLLSALATAAGSPSVGTPSVDTNYGAPNFTRWNLIGKPLPLLMDAAARSVGLRYTITLDGASAAYVSYATAKIAADQIYQDAEESGQIVLGGQNAKVLTNATGSALSMIGNIPESVVVKFWAESGLPADYDTETVTLSSLALTGYSGLDGVPGSFGVIMADQEASVTSPTQADYAETAATDYYNWLLSLNDFVVSSIIAFESSGLEDCIEWEYLSPREAPAQLALGATSNSQMELRQTRAIRLLTRVIPFDWHDNAIYGGGTPNGSSQTTEICSVFRSLEDTSCLLLTGYGTPAGRCQDVNTAQSILLVDYDSDGVWTGNEQFITDTGSWDVEYDWPNGESLPRLKIGSVYLRYLECVDNKLRFVGYGSILCDAEPDEAPCADNSFIVELKCTFCEGWYCASLTDDPGDCEPLYLEEYDPDILICSGPYKTFAEAFYECGVWDDTGVDGSDCDSVANHAGDPLTAVIVSADDVSLLGTSFSLTQSVGVGIWSGCVNEDEERVLRIWCGQQSGCSEALPPTPACWRIDLYTATGGCTFLATNCYPAGTADNIYWPSVTGPFALQITVPANCVDSALTGNIIFIIYDESNPP